MPSVDEGFVKLVQLAIKAGTEACQLCDEGAAGICNLCNGRKKCDLCEGAGWTGHTGPDFVVGPDGETMEMADRRTPKSPCPICQGSGACRACEGEGLCPNCDGEGKFVPHEFSDEVLSAVLATVVVQVAHARSVERFDTMNRLIDLSSAWVLNGNQKFIDNATPEQKEKYAKTLAEGVESAFREEVGLPPLVDAPKEPGNSALTKDELRELGVLENDDGTDQTKEEP